MTFKGRLLIALAHGIARLLDWIKWVRRKVGGAPKPPKGPERHLILLAEGPMVQFMGVAFWHDKIIEQYGVVGIPSPREQHPLSIRDNIMDRVTELMEEGYVRLEDFPGRASVTLTGGAAPANDPAPALRQLADFLADRGLGFLGEFSPGPDGALTLDTPAPALAGPLVVAFLEKQGLGPWKVG